MRFRSSKVTQRGDTIVEVLIAVAVVSSVLAGAFAVSQKSTLAVRDSQERSEALQVLQGQVELVRALALTATNNTTGIFATTPPASEYFCIRESDRTRVNFSSTLPTLPSDSFQSSVYNPDCLNLKGRYNVAVTYKPAAETFVFTSRWHGVDGQKKQQQMSYRIYPGVTTVATIPTPGPSPVCTVGNASDIILTLDASSSMVNNSYPSGSTRLARLKVSASSFVANATIGATANHAAVIEFNNTATVEQGLTPSKPDLTNAINGLTSATNTKYIPALNKTQQELNNFGRPGTKKTVIFISDGLPDESLTQVYNKTDSLDAAGIIIYTVGIQTAVTGGDVVLSNMARNGGTFHEASTEAELDTILNNLAAHLDCT